MTIQKLQRRIAELEQATSGSVIALSPVYIAPADGPMTPPPSSSASWLQLEIGQAWGYLHSTCWLRTTLQVSESLSGQALLLQLHWPSQHNDDSLLLQVEATVFLDDQAIGALDWRHLTLLLPPAASDGQSHNLTIQAYTRQPFSFAGLTLTPRYETIWRFYFVMQTAYEALLTMSDTDLVYHALLARLNEAYNLLDLREGWLGERFATSASVAMTYLREHLHEGLSSGNRSGMVVSGHAHLDLAWMWPYWRTHQKIAHTVSNVLALMDRYPDYHYSQSQPQALQWLKEDLPELYARVKTRVTEGRFEPIGAMWVEADCNLTSGESLIRQILHGIRFTEEEFGITPQCVWLPDVFGYSAALPQIMRGCDLPVFMTTKISWNQFNRMPCDTFRWRGIDGSEVLTHFVTAPDVSTTHTYYTYNGPLRARDIPGTWANYRQKAINTELLYLAGWGDGGGGPTEDMLERVKTLGDLPGFPRVRMGRASEFFTDLYERVWQNPLLPTWVGELYLEYHRGTYTSQARMKQGNRRAELFYREVEFLQSWASIYGMPSRQEQLNAGWKRILLNQFHDVLPGSSITEVYPDALQLYTEARMLGEEIRTEALSFLGKHFSWQEHDLVLLNTLPWERNDPIQIPLASAVNLEGQRGRDWDGNTFLLLDGVGIPPLGVATSITYPIEENPACGIMRNEANELVLYNLYYELTINAQGEMSRLYDKWAERDVFVEGQSGNQLIAYEDRPLNYDAWDIDLFYEEKPYPLHAVSHIAIIEEGPTRTTVEIAHPFMQSRVTQRISLWRQSPRIDIATEIDWHEHQTLLKATFPLAINATLATYEIQFGHVQRPTHRNTSWDLARFEVCAHRWVDLGEGNYGISLLNDSKYGHDIHDNVLRLTLLKSGILPDPQADQGIHRFMYSLLPHQGDFRQAQTVQRAYELNVPVLTVQPEKTNVAPPELHSSPYSFLSCDCPHVVVETIKPAEDGKGLIIRLYEAHNQRGRGSLTFATTIIAAEECNLLEKTLAPVSFLENNLVFQVRPFEIKTFRVQFTPKEA